jgi:hypothetical protein
MGGESPGFREQAKMMRAILALTLRAAFIRPNGSCLFVALLACVG